MRARTFTIGVVTAVLVVGVATLSLWIAPTLLVSHMGVSLSGKDLSEALSSARTATVALVASFATAASVFVAARAYIVTRAGMQGEQLSRATEEMFSDQASRRIAAVHAITAYSSYNSNSRRVAISVLAAFVRDATKARSEEDELDRAVVAALKALGEFKRIPHGTIDLSHSRLYDAILTGTNLSGWVFDHANLDGADLARCKVHRASFRDASLTGAKLSGLRKQSTADFTGADTRGTQLE